MRFESDDAQKHQDAAQLSYLEALRQNGCKFLFKTQLFGKQYVWMKDTFGTIFLEKMPEMPVISMGPYVSEDGISENRD